MRRNIPGNETTTRQIGRGGVAVLDPFQPDAARLGVVHARRVDHDAMLLADEFARLSDKELSRQAVSLRAAFAWLDNDLIENTRKWDAALATVRTKYAMAEEGLIVLETLVRQSPGSWDLLKRWEEQQVLVDRLEVAVIGLSEQRKLDGGRSVDAELNGPRRRGAAKAVAVAREQAIRAAERRRGRRRAAESLGPPAGVRQVGTGAVTRAREERRDREYARRNARVVTRADVVAPRALDQLRPLIGESRASELERLMRPLAAWVAQEDDAWVHRRHAELGNASRKLDRGAARRARMAEMHHDAEQVERARAWSEAKRFRNSHPELADVVDEWADDEVVPYERSRNYLDAWLDRNLDRVVKALVYQDEVEIRRHLEVMQEIEGSIVDPPEQLRSLIGDGRRLGEPEREAWEALARELEGERLLRESAAREGSKHKGPKVKERRELEARVERFRAEVGLEPRAREARVEVGGVGMG